MSVKTKIQAHVESEIKEQIDKMARLEGRSISNLAARILTDWLYENDYRLKPPFLHREDNDE